MVQVEYLKLQEDEEKVEYSKLQEDEENLGLKYLTQAASSSPSVWPALAFTGHNVTFGVFRTDGITVAA